MEGILAGNGDLRKLNPTPYRFTEGPANDGRGGLYFVDYTQNWIVRHDMNSGAFAVWASDTQGANGAVFTREGEQLSCRGVAADVVRWNGDGTVNQVLASEFQGVRFNAPNDLIISRSGWIYFTDPDFPGANRMPDAVYARSPQGDITRIDEHIARPNGIVLTPDEKVLIIDGTFQRELIAFDVLTDGSVTNRRIFGCVRDPDRDAYPGYPQGNWFGCDGMAVDMEGNLYVTCGAGVEVFNAEGRSLGAILIPEKPTNTCFGGPDNRTLYVTAQTSVYAVSCQIPGVVFQQ